MIEAACGSVEQRVIYHYCGVEAFRSSLRSKTRAVDVPETTTAQR